MLSELMYTVLKPAAEAGSGLTTFLRRDISALVLGLLMLVSMGSKLGAMQQVTTVDIIEYQISGY